MIRRLSLHSLAVRLARHLDSPAKFLETLNRPQLRDILETLDENEAALFFILGPVQFFKTLVGQLYLLRCHLLRPSKIGWYAPTGDFAKDFADTKLNLLLDTFPEILARQYDTGLRGNYDKTKTTKLRRSYVGGASHLLLSANNENDRTGKTLEKVLCDEPHLYEPGWLDQIFKRTKDYETTAVKLLMSTGMTRGQDVKGGEAAQIWDQTDQRLWFSRCPNCRKFWEPRYLLREKPDDPESPIIGGLLYDRVFLPNGLPNEMAIGASLRYKCPKCGSEKFPDTEASRVALNGTYEQPFGQYIPQNSSPSRRHYGWNFSALAGRAWLPIVMDWERAHLARTRGDLEPLGKVIREHFGGIWQPLDHLKESRIRPPGGYRMAINREGLPSWTTPKFDLRAWWAQAGFDAAGAPYAFAKIDVHQNWLRLVIRAWNRFSQSRLLYADTVTNGPSRCAEIADMLGILRSRTVIDGNYNTQVVRRWAGQFGWRVFRGEAHEKDYPHPDKVRRIFSEEDRIDPFQGTAHQGQCRILEYKFAKWSALDRLMLLRSLKANDGTALFTAADDAPEWYFEEIDDYGSVPKFIKGVETREWQSKSNDHSADAEIMGVVAAAATGCTGAESLSGNDPVQPLINTDEH